MNKTADKKRPPLSTLYRLSPAGHIIAAVSAALILLHLLTRDDHALMVWASERLVRPVHRALAVLNDHLPLSVAELLIGLAVIAVLIYIIYTTIKLIRCGGRLKRLYAAVINLLAAGLAVYAGFCMLWGVYYYGDDFMTRSGLKNDNISVEQLEILKDSHCGAFAVIRLCCYFAAHFGLCGSVRFTPRVGLCWTLALVLERALSGFAVAAFPLAKGTGLAHTFATAADKQTVRRFLCGLSALLILALTALGGGGLAAAALLALWRYDSVAKKQFGGITGDLAGWFLQRAELWMLAALAVSQWGGML